MKKLSLDVATTKRVILGLTILVVLMVGFLVALSVSNRSSEPVETLGYDQQVQVPPETLKYSAEWVEEFQSSPFNCWTIIDEEIYDITEFIASHIDREVLLSVCGANGTDIFKQQDIYHQVKDGNLPEGMVKKGELRYPKRRFSDFL